MKYDFKVVLLLFYFILVSRLDDCLTDTIVTLASSPL